MNTLTKNIGIGAITLAIFAVFMIGSTATAYATDGGESYDYFVPDMSSGGGSSYDYYVPSTPSYGGGTSYDYYVPDTYSSGYGSSYFGGYGGSSFGGFGGSGGFFTPSVGGGGNFNAPTSNLVTNNGNTYTYAPQNTNVCTGGNVCNDNSIYDGRIVITGNNTTASQPVQPIYQQPVIYQQPIYTQPVPTYIPPAPTYRAPYVSLSAVPYTGLDLGTMGTIAYWAFLAIWCLAAAYLIAVKKVQNKIVAGLNGFLFPTAAGHAHSKHTARVYNAHVAHAPKAPAKAVVATETGIDSFIQSQINRSR